MTQKIKFKGGIIATCMAVLIAMCMTVIISGCTSTELVDAPQSSGTKGQTITLNISCPEADAATRVDNDPHSGHVLRYSAILYSGGDLKTATQKERREITVSTDINQPQEIIFEVEEGVYSCIVFADYILEGISQTNGTYEDVYYNTQHLPEHIYMRSFIDFSTANNNDKDKVDVDCFNNENYDCFAFFEQNIEKKELEKIVNVTLNRIVSRVSVQSRTEMPDGVEINDININKFDFLGSYALINKQATANAGLSTYGLPPFKLNTNNSVKDELFYFYTFAPDTKSSTSLLQIAFDINLSNNTNRNCKIDERLIYPIQNYKITVKGSFLSDPKVDVGNLILNIASPNVEGWVTQEPIIVN